MNGRKTGFIKKRLTKLSLIFSFLIQILLPSNVFGDVIDCSLNFLTPLEDMICDGTYRSNMDTNLLQKIGEVNGNCFDATCQENVHKNKVTLLARYLESHNSFVPFNSLHDFYINPELKPVLEKMNDRFQFGGEYLKLENDHYFVSGSPDSSEADEIIPSKQQVIRLFGSSTNIRRVELYKGEDWTKYLFTTTFHISGASSSNYYVVGFIPNDAGKIDVTLDKVFSFEEEFQTPKYGTIDPDKPMECGTFPVKGARPMDFIKVLDLNGDSIKDLEIPVKLVDCTTGEENSYKEIIYIRKEDYSAKRNN